MKKKIKKVAVPSGAVFNEDNGHILVEEGGNIVEKKYCYRCKKWHPIDCFGKDKKRVDGLNVVCKNCDRIYQLSRKKNHKKVVQKNTEPLKFNPVEDLNKIMNSYINSIISEYQKRANDYISTIENLKRKIKVLESHTDMSKMSNKDFEKMLMERKDIQPRVLFNAIKNLDIDKKWVFFCRDNTTGVTYPIKPEIF